MVPTWYGGTNEVRHENQKKDLRYQKAGKKDNAKILGEYAWTLNYKRDYLAYLLANWEKTGYSVSGGKQVKYVAKGPVIGRCKALKGIKSGRPEKYCIKGVP